jgi:nucleotide-binding universal stress UspA family protein
MTEDRSDNTDIRPIVVGVDGSRFGREALRWALAEAARRDCAVRALLVAHVAPVIAGGRPTTVGMGIAVSGAPSEEYLHRLAGTVRAVLGEHDDPRLTAEVVRGSAPETLCLAARDAQLLVLGSRGHGQMFQAVLGSVSQYCVRHATCPVVVIPGGLAEPAESVSHAAPPADPQPLSYTVGPLL